MVVHTVELVLAHVWRWVTVGIKLAWTSVVVVTLASVVVLHLLWHWWEGHTIWEVWKWVDQLSSLFLVVVERAAFTELALTFIEEVLAWLSLVVGVNCTKCCLTEVLGKWLKTKVKN